MKKFALFFIFVTCFMLRVTNVNAQYGQYGGPGPSYTILIDKMVAKPNSNTDYVDNLAPSDPRFKPDQEVFFKLEIKNTSNVNLTNVTVKDFVPSYLEPVEGPGSFDSSTGTIIFSAGDFAVDEEKIYYLKMKVMTQNLLPNDKGLFCIVNKSQAYNDKTSDEDSSQLCVEKQVLGVVKTPSAGPEMGAFLITGEMLLLGLGLYLKKKFDN